MKHSSNVLSHLESSMYQLFDTDFVMQLDSSFEIVNCSGKLLEKYQIHSHEFIGQSFLSLTKSNVHLILSAIKQKDIAMIDWMYTINQKIIHLQSALIKENVNNKECYFVQTREVTTLKKYEKVLKQTLNQYETVANILTSGIAVLDIVYDVTNQPVNYVFSFVNNAFASMTALHPNKIIGKKLSDITLTAMPYWHNVYKKAIEARDSVSFDRYSETAKKWYSTSIMFQEPNQLIVMMVDITERVQLLDQYEVEKKRLARVIDSSIDIIFEIDLSSRFVWAAGKGLSKIGKQPEEYVGKTVTEVFGDDGNERQNYYNQSLKGIECSYIWHYSIGEETFFFESTISPIVLDDGSIIGAVGIARDITEQRIKQCEIEYLSYHDQLTNIYNRRYYEQELKHLNSPEYLPLTLCVIDVNGLKLVNDAFGHESGDIVLSKTANILQSNKRDQDVVARVGGDEFVVLLPNTQLEEAKLVMKQINQLITEEKIKSLPLSISYGLHTRKTMDEDLSDVFRIAEDNMYSRKLHESSSMKTHAIDIIMKTLFEKNDREEKHCKRVSELCVKIASKMRFSDIEINKIKTAGLLHDIGKIVIDADILNKPVALNDHEWAEMRRHPDVGYRILSSISEYAPLANIILSHHERWDGTGYPRRLSGEEIPVFSRIMAVADAFDAMTMMRPYRGTKSTKEALDELRSKKGSQFDPRVVDVFTQIIEESSDPELTDVKRFERLVAQINQLSNGKIGLFPKRDFNPTSTEQFLKEHGFGGYTITFNDKKVLYFGYHAYIPLRQMESFETELPWRILQPYTIGETPISSAGLCINGVIGTTNPRGTGAIYQNNGQKPIVLKSKYVYGYQGDVWGSNRYGMLHLGEHGVIKHRFSGVELATGVDITLKPKEYLITLFEADRYALGGPMDCYAVSPYFEEGNVCKIEYHEKLIYHGE